LIPQDTGRHEKRFGIEMVQANLRKRSPLAGAKHVWDHSLLVPGLVTLLTLLYIVLFAWLSILRHETFQSSAMDLGYTDQVVWNTLHGRFMRFSTYQDAPIDLPLAQFRRTDTLLAYHVELILAPISLLYLIYDSSVTLLVLQTVGIGLGALPAFWLARDHLGSDFAGLVFALAYLLAPAVEGANLSDFHAVSLTASLLLFAFYFLQARLYGLLFVFIILAMSTKEDISLLIMMMGLYTFFWLRERKIGALTALMGLGWFLICTQVILPYHNGLPISPFLHRTAIFGPTVKESLHNLLWEPMLLLRWLRQPEIVTYLGGLLASAGFMSLFSPIVLSLSAPVVAMNVFSTWSWTYSEGAHYSASIVPFVIVSGIYGLGFLARQISEWWGFHPRRAVNGLTALVLLISGYHHYRIGISPLARGFHPPRITPHHRLAREFMALIPADAPLSAQSSLYPHLAHREKAYLFPAVNDAEYIFLDVTSPPYPIAVEKLHWEIQRLLNSHTGFGLLAARDGYLLLNKGLSESLGRDLPDEFYTFARADEGFGGVARAVPFPLRAHFADVLELVGYDYSILNVIHAHQLPATVTTYWRPLQPLDLDYGFTFFFTRQDGAIVGCYAGGTPTSLWYPTSVWQEGEVIRMETPILPIGRLRNVMVAVTLPTADPWSVEGRLRPIESASGQPLELSQERSLLKLFSFP
jgi:uncharacterized membrane protein